MISIYTHVMKPVRDTNSEPGWPVVIDPENAKEDKHSVSKAPVIM